MSAIRRAKLSFQKRPDGFLAVTGGQETVYAAKQGPWTVLTNRPQWIPRLIAVREGQGESLAATIDPGARKTLFWGDASFYANLALPPHNWDTLAASARSVAPAGTASVASDAGLFAGMSDEQRTKATDAVLAVIDDVIGSLADLRWAAGWVEFDKSSLRGKLVVRTTADGPLGKALGSFVPQKLTTIEKLPRGEMAYLATSCSLLPQQWIKRFVDSILPDSPEARRCAKATDALAKANLKEDAWSLAEVEELTANPPVTYLAKADDLQRLREFFALTDSGILSRGSDDERVWVEPAREKVGSHSIDLITTRCERSKETRQTTVDGYLVRVDGSGSGRLERYLDQLIAGEDLLKDDPAFWSIRPKLDDEASFLCLCDLQRASALALARMIPVMAEAADNRGPRQLRASYSGISVVTRPGHLGVKWHVPADQLSVLVGFFPGAFYESTPPDQPTHGPSPLLRTGERRVRAKRE